MYFPDLSTYRYVTGGRDVAINVGWLSPAHEYPQGPVKTAIVDALLRLARDRPVNRTRGWHPCELCAKAEYPIRMLIDGQSLALGDTEIRVRADTALYAAPTLIAHYVAHHGYQPPEDFAEALLSPLR